MEFRQFPNLAHPRTFLKGEASLGGTQNGELRVLGVFSSRRLLSEWSVTAVLTLLDLSV